MLKKLAVIIPAYEESENIARLSQEIVKFYPEADVLVVDDSPNFLSVEAIQKLSHPKIKIIHRQAKGGRGSAVIDGLSEMLKKESPEPYDYFLEIDADFSHPPSQIPELIKVSEEKHLDLLIASRYMAGSKIENWPLSRRIFSRTSNIVAKTLLQVPVNDYTNGFRLYSRRATEEILRSCGRLGSGFIALSEILVNLYYRDYKVSEVPTRFINRVRGKSSLSRKEITNAVLGLIKIYSLKSKLVSK